MNTLKIGTCILFLALSSCTTLDSDRDNEEVLTVCDFEDGIHRATVDYYNPDTDFSNTYMLDVEVEDCQVVKIEFPKGGWLDSDHIEPTEIENDGSCSIEDDEGRTYSIQIEN